MLWLTGIVGLFAGCLATIASASAYCPGPVAIVEDLGLNAHVLPLVRKVYRKLDCELTTSPFPGRRGVVAFNAGDVSGELFRLRLIENSYEIEFVRSQWPVLHPKQAIWVHASKALGEESKIGFVIGRWWQENYARSHATQHRFVEYGNSSDLWSDFERHALDGFLATPALVETLVGNGKLSERPSMARMLKSAPMFHYLSADYADFMADFSKALKDETPAQ